MGFTCVLFSSPLSCQSKPVHQTCSVADTMPKPTPLATSAATPTTATLKSSQRINLSNSPSTQPKYKKRKLDDAPANPQPSPNKTNLSYDSTPQPPANFSQTPPSVQSKHHYDTANSRRGLLQQPKSEASKSGRSSKSPHSSQRRSLRSQDGKLRVKSDLAKYFPDYEEVVFGPPRDPSTFPVACI